jgi:GxxExxY protein
MGEGEPSRQEGREGARARGNHEGRNMEFDPLSKRVIGCAIEVHRTLGPGLMESTYERCIAHEFEMAGIGFRLQQALPIQYKGLQLDGVYRVDVLVEETMILELKSVDTILPIHQAQLLTYMKLAGIKTGLLINFNVPRLKAGIRRFVL